MNELANKNRWDVIIVGAGPAGLSTAYWLQQAGVEFCLLEKERVGSSWHHHYDNLALHTLKGVSGLPGWPIPADFPNFVPRHLFANYLERYAARFNFPIFESTVVQQAAFETTTQYWHINTSSGEFAARLLVVATGIWSTPHWPAIPGLNQFPGRVTHAQTYKNNRPFVNQRVLVLGGGNSGTEMAVEISEVAQETTIAIRGGTTFVAYPTSTATMKAAAWLFRHLPAGVGHQLLKWTRPDFSSLNLLPPTGYLTDAYPVVGFELPEAVKAGRVRAVAGGIRHIEGNCVNFEDGQAVEVDHIVLATGYRPTVGFLAPSAIQLDEKGWPILATGGRSPVQDTLFCVGFTYPNTEGWLQSIPRHSQQTGAAVIDQLAQAKGVSPPRSVAAGTSR